MIKTKTRTFKAVWDRAGIHYEEILELSKESWFDFCIEYQDALATGNYRLIDLKTGLDVTTNCDSREVYEQVCIKML